MRTAVLSPLGMDSSGFDSTAELAGRMPIVRGIDERVGPNRIFTAKAAADLYAAGRDPSNWLLAGPAFADGDDQNPVFTQNRRIRIDS